jgi:transposase-like protein
LEDIGMARMKHTAEEIVAKLRLVDALISQGRPVAESIRSIGITKVAYYRWRAEYDGLMRTLRPVSEPASRKIP